MNPLQMIDGLPDYGRIKAADVLPALTAELARCRSQITKLLDQPEASFTNLVQPFETLQHRLARVFAPVAHLNSVTNSTELREAYNACLPLLAEYQAEVGQNLQLYKAYEKIQATEAEQLSDDQRKVLSFALRDFRLAGVHLNDHDKARYTQLMQELSTLQARFEENVLDATRAWSYHVTDSHELLGLPDHLIERARSAAVERQLDGWVFLLDYPNYQGVLTHADSQALRRAYYTAWSTRASDQSPESSQYDNSNIMSDILNKRLQLALLLGFKNYAELSLATKMAPSTQHVLKFLEELARNYLPGAKKEFDELQQYAGSPLNAWDVAYYSEKLSSERFQVSEERLRPWFPLPKVLGGLFEVARRLYGLRISEEPGISTWNSDVRYYSVKTALNTDVGGFYADFYSRENKRGGAWMGEITNRIQLSTHQALPIANLVCNFTPPAPNMPALLRHSDVVTLFHEFGHTLHHLMTQVDYPSLAGINGVPWDAMELPSQLMEEWAWQPSVLPLLSGHVETGDPLPTEELDNLLRSRTFQSGLAAVRQLEFALFDFKLHAEFEPGAIGEVARVLSEVRALVSVIPAPKFNRFAHSFSHIFAGGYAAGYYSYKWAEVLAADAFSAFEQSDIFDQPTAQKFLNEILSRGGSCDQMQAFIAFRGREPDIGSLLRKDGFAA